MKITANTFAFEMSEKEVGVWMTALQLAATDSIGTIFPSESCPFFIQHGELSRLTGYGIAEHDRLKEKVLTARGKA